VDRMDISSQQSAPQRATQPPPSPPPPARPSWHLAVKGNVLAMGLVSFFTDFSSEMMNPLLPIYLLGLVAPGPEVAAKAAFFVGLMEGIAETTASLLKIVSGRLSDVLGKRKALVLAGYGLSSLARPAIALTAAIWQVIALKFLDRVGKGVRTSPRDALIGDSVPADVRGLAFSFHRSMDHLGAVLGPLVAITVLYALLGKALWKGSAGIPGPAEMSALRWLFAIAVIPGTAAMLWLATKVREVPAKKRPEDLSQRTQRTQSGQGDLEEARGDGSGKSDSLRSLRPLREESPPAAAPGVPSVWKKLPRRFYMFVAAVCLFALGNSSDLFIVTLAKVVFGMDLMQLVGLWVALHVSKIAFSIPGGMISDRLGRGPVIVTGWAVYMLVYLGLAFASQAWQLWALILVYGFYYGMTEGAEKALVTDFIPSEFRSTAFGIYHGAIGIAALPASFLFGLVWLRFGRHVPFLLGAAFAGAATAVLLVLLAGRVKEAG
jgi:MFS family permease